MSKRLFQKRQLEIPHKQILDWWQRNRLKSIYFACFFLLLFALRGLFFGFRLLILGADRVFPSAIEYFHDLVNTWFSGIPVYSKLGYAVYPPATQVILWPLLGWLPMMSARWLWLLATVVFLSLLVFLFVKISGARDWPERLFIGLVPLAAYATSSTIGNGQLTIFVIVLILAGFILLQHQGLGFDFVAAILFTLALVKPTLGAPFIWIVLFLPRRKRPILFIITMYLGLTLFASSFQDEPLVDLTWSWLQRAAEGVAYGAQDHGYANQSSWLLERTQDNNETAQVLTDRLQGSPVQNPNGNFLSNYLRRGQLFIAKNSLTSIPTIMIFLLLGVMSFLIRFKNVWLQIGIIAIISRFAVYHGGYDDLLILLALIPLFHIFIDFQKTDQTRFFAGMLFVVGSLSLVIKDEYLGFYIHSSTAAFSFRQTLIWLVLLLFLIFQAWQEKNQKSKRPDRFVGVVSNEI